MASPCPPPPILDSSTGSFASDQKTEEGPVLEVYLLFLPTFYVQLSIICCHLTAREASKYSLVVYSGRKGNSMVNNQQVSPHNTVLYKSRPIKSSVTHVPAQLGTCFPRQTRDTLTDLHYQLNHCQ